MDKWIEKGFYIIRIKHVHPSGFESKEPLMQKIKKGVSVLLIWRNFIDAKNYIKKNMNEEEECFVTEEDIEFYYNMQDSYKKINEQLALKVVE